MVNKFLLAGDKFMPEDNDVIMYNACGPFT